MSTCVHGQAVWEKVYGTRIRCTFGCHRRAMVRQYYGHTQSTPANQRPPEHPDPAHRHLLPTSLFGVQFQSDREAKREIGPRRVDGRGVVIAGGRWA